MSAVFLWIMRSPLKTFFFPLLLLIFIGCKKEIFTSSGGAILKSTADTLHFDTVFTTTGSVSQFFKIINDNDKGIRVNAVRLAGGVSSAFRINVDGIAGPEVRNVEIGARDSIYIYVTVSINPTSASLPFLISDSIEVDYNGNKLKVQLEAFGQNARFLRNRSISTSETWNSELPYVILGGLIIEPNALLTITKGTRIFVHADAPIIIQGSLQVFGEAPDSTRVVFTGDRLDEPYRSFPASYPGLIFTESSKNNIIRYGIIKNAYQALVLIEQSPGTKLLLQQTIIDNAYDVGILALNSSLKAENLQVTNSGKNIMLLKGGNYVFEHCTSATYSTAFGIHKDPVLTVSNFITQNNVAITAPLQAVFRNCIFWGESGGLVENEVNVIRQGTSSYNVAFENVLWKMAADPVNASVTGSNIKNQNPQFESIMVSERLFNFRLSTTSPAIDKGSPTSINLDLDGRPRPVNLPDLGAYEKQ
jgi:hypothetical protein